MKNKLLKYFIRSIILSSSFTFYLSLQLFGQPQIETTEKTEISGGAEYSIYLEKMINSGMGGMLKYKGTVPNDPLYKTDLITTIEGINFNEDASNSGFYHIPPDPHGAAGPNHLVSVVNTSIEWFTNAGATENSQSLASFFSTLTPLTNTFDPKVIYDQYNGRFVVVSLERTTGPNTSRILVAVSQTSDPNSGWYFTSINSAVTISSLCWADYPGLAVTDDAILITNNMFSFSGNSFQGSRLWIIQKSPFYTTGTGAVVNIYDPSSLDGDPITNNNFTMQPAHMFGTLPAGAKSYLVATGYSAGSTDYFSVITIGGTSSSPTFTNTFVSHLSDIHNTGVAFPEAPQPGTDTLINTPGNRVMNAVWRNNNLWAVNTINPPSGGDAGQATAHWYRMGTSGTISIADQGNIGGEDIAVGTYTFYPSIAVNSVGDAIMGFAASAPTIYCGAYYVGRYSTTPAGTVLASQVFKPGLATYVRTFGSGRNRWGDYSGSSVDPSDDLTFYIFNEYALTRGTNLGDGELGRWGTAFGVVPVTALPVELSSFIAKSSTDGVQLDWVTETEVNNYGFEIQRNQMNPNSEIQNPQFQLIGFIEGHGNSNSPKEYIYLDKGISYGSFAYRLKQIDNDGTFEYSDIVEVEAGDIPEGFVLEQNYPNPFNPSTIIKFALVESQQATLNIYDILGNEIAQLFNETTEAGKVYEIEFDASGLSSGVYYYRLSTPQTSLVRKLLLLR